MMNDEISCLVIGSGGFLGASTISAMKDEGIKHFNLSHQGLESEYSFFEIDRPMIQDSSDFTHAIYFSWSMNRSFEFQKKSYVAAKYAADWAMRNNVRIVFISSMSASASSPRSNYGHFKKLAEQYYTNLGFQVVRPGTVLSKENSEGAALVQLQNLSKFGRTVLASFKPIFIPVIYVDVFTNTLLQTVMNDSPTGPRNLVEEITTVQSILDLKTGWIPIRWIQILLPIVPVNSRDRLQTLIDLN